MKYIRYKAEFLDVYGAPISLIDPDQRKQRAIREEAIEEALAKPNGTKADAKWEPARIEEATFADLICIMADGIPYGPQPAKDEPPLRSNHEERGFATHVIRAFRDQEDGHVILEEKALEWLVNELKENGDFAYKGTVPVLLLERLEGDDAFLTAREQADLEDAEKKATKGKGMTPVEEEAPATA